MRFRISDAAKVVAGQTIGVGDVEATGVAVDSRAARPGDLFVALPGEFFDGHDFVAGAAGRGAAGAIVGRRVEASIPQIVVAHPLSALTKLAAWARDVIDPAVVGITGSTGKTSTKDLLSAIASQKFSTVVAEKSFNNEVGVPLTLLRAAAETEVVVCELGSRGAGQIKQLCEFVRPHIGVVTNVGVTHFEQFGSRDAIAAAKAELVEAISEGGSVVLNADDEYADWMAKKTEATVLTFGMGAGAWIRASDVDLDRSGRARFRMVRGPESVWAELNVAGRHQVANALAASAAALALGLSLEECRTGLARAKASPWRMETSAAAGVTVVNDAYNASPDSMASALQTCAAMASGKGRLVAVLGHMAELGDLEATEHERIGQIAAATADRLVVVGEKAAGIAAGARAAGLREVTFVAGADEAASQIGPLEEGDVVLIKASRVARLEGVAASIKTGLERN
jgi:UDP-N-acetylmuramoyl-tripeptide--D-alanyl-D-alanine ligase